MNSQQEDFNDQEGGDPPQDFTSCMFCGFHDPQWTENDLDVHYWKDCPLLISCPSCAQIVEIAGLPEHLLDECDAKDSYVSRSGDSFGGICRLAAGSQVLSSSAQLHVLSTVSVLGGGLR
mmetsp:Transcript_15235/g.22435  ORF Transcript_15235/g.22435 Transcript_15235/m.22435 type:complete len:120 (-) Transcript_15235:775-1134(-)